MMKKLMIIFFIVFVGMINTPAQPAKLSIQNIEGQAGDTLRLSLMAENIHDVGAISLKISYDSDELEYVGLENGAVDFLTNSKDSVITVGWFDMTAKNPITLSDNKLLDLVFVKKDGEGKISFIKEACEISTSSGEPIAVNYADGSE